MRQRDRPVDVRLSIFQYRRISSQVSDQSALRCVRAGVRLDEIFQLLHHLIHIRAAGQFEEDILQRLLAAHGA